MAAAAEGFQSVRAPRAQVAKYLQSEEAKGYKLIAEGLANKDIATRLFLSEGTVKNHVSVIMAKLQANSRADVVAKAYREGMVRPRS